MSGKIWIAIGGLLGALGVLFGAFGAHALPNYFGMSLLEPAVFQYRLEIFETAARYHMYHALAIVAVGIVGLLSERTGRAILLDVAGATFLAGILIFSGCLYALALTGIKWLGAIVPIGGVSFVVGWIGLASAAYSITWHADENAIAPAKHRMEG